ncbi:MAG: hypothetical protein ACOCY5_01950 [Desulfohalobiaceae bacterium]
MSQNPEAMCVDCNHCFPDRDGPTEMGICLLDPELEPYVDEILELDFTNCGHLIHKKRFDFNCRACEQFSAAEILDLGDDIDQDMAIEAIKSLIGNRKNR